jgi:peptidoglycan/LPS O-acetylase OafA/YrhL
VRHPGSVIGIGAPSHPALRFTALDGLRLVAAAAVIATHAGFWSGSSLRDSATAPLLARGDFGVSVFFLLSAFLLYQPFADAAITRGVRPGLRRYARTRLARIVPACWVMIILVLSVITDRHPGLGEWIAYLTFTHPYGAALADPALTHLWTLSVELAFYALLPVLALSLRSRAESTGTRRVVLRQGGLAAGLSVISLVWAVAAIHEVGLPSRATAWLPAYLDWFALGMLLAVARARCSHPGGERSRLGILRDLASAPGSCWAAAGMLWGIATLPLAGPLDLNPPTAWEWVAKHELYGAAAFLMLLPCVLGKADSRLCRVLGSPPTAALGTLSYGIYLWHLPLLTVMVKVLGLTVFQGGFGILVASTSVAAVVVATISYVGVERPILRWARHHDITDSGVTHAGVIDTNAAANASEQPA